MLPKRLHHLTFLVRDLEEAARRHERTLGLHFGQRTELPTRGVATVRAYVGELWLVLAQPIGPGAPADHLARHGEGCFIVSYAVDDLDAALAALVARGASSSPRIRTGLDGWRIADVFVDPDSGIVTQLCEARQV